MEALATRLQGQGINRVHVVDKEVDADLERLPRVASTTCLKHGVSEPKCSVQKLPVRTECTLILKFLCAKRGLCERYKTFRLIERVVSVRGWTSASRARLGGAIDSC